MGFSSEWNETYKKSQHLSIWPWSDLVSYVMRYSRPQTDDFTVLEIGCGAGANISFFKHLNVEYYGIDGSEAIIVKLKERFPQEADRLLAVDFTQSIPFTQEFDLIVDRASITHNKITDIRKSIDLIHGKLKPNGKFIGIDWFSTEHTNYSLGGEEIDTHTRTNFSTGQFVGLGNVHFSDKTHILELFAGFEITHMEHKQNRQEIPSTGHLFASWNFVAVKR